MSALGQVLAQLLDGFLTPDQVGRQMIGCAVSSLITLLAVFIVVTDKRASTKVGNGTCNMTATIAHMWALSLPAWGRIAL